MVTTQNPQAAEGDRFEWHPEYAGSTREAVFRQLTDDLARDQRAYNLALENAEKEEHAALNSILELEKRWGQYHFSWQETDPHELASSIADFEWAREQKHEMFSWKSYRASGQAPSVVSRPASTVEPTGRSAAASGLMIVVGILALVAILAVVFTLL